MTRLYGIPNCDTVRKARKWMGDNGIPYDFHDFKKKGLERSTLLSWIDTVGWETLLNRRGMMWRRLDPDLKQGMDRKTAISVMLDTPTIIKRPVLNLDGAIHVGFSEAEYRKLFYLSA